VTPLAWWSAGDTAVVVLASNFGASRHPTTIEAALRDGGLPASLADAGDNERYDEALRASHREGITLVGADVGSPIIAIPDAAKIAFFGPVVNPGSGGLGRSPPVGEHHEPRLHRKLLRN
jgi:hypothetical protein